MRKSIYPLEFKLFFSGSSAWIGIAVLLITGIAGLYFGKTFIDNQKTVIERAAQLQEKNTQNNIHHFGKDIGLVFYHNKFSTAHVPDNWAAFSNGQRDINPYVISVTMLALEGQLYDTEISNPVSMLLGNMDLSFVFIFIFPLVIIAFTYNLISEQRENGVWSLLKSQTNQLFKVMMQKLAVRMITVFGVMLLLMLIALIYLPLPVNLTLFNVLAVIILYLAFWFAASFLLISLGKSSSYNASALVALWVAMCIVIPAVLNLVLSQQFPVPEALQNVMNQREGYHEKWDMPKAVTMKPFFEHYPQLKKYPFPGDLAFSWFWYYGMQQMGDDHAAKSKKSMQKKLASRQYFSNLAANIFPAVQAQLSLNELAGSDLNSHLKFQQAVRTYHEQIRLRFYPSIFQNHDISTTKLQQVKLKEYQVEKMYSWNRLLSLLFLILILIAIGLRQFKSLSLLK